MDTAAVLSGMLGDLYATAHDPSRLDAFLRGAARHTRSHIAALHIQDLRSPSGDLVSSIGVDTDGIRGYAEFAAENPWMARSQALVRPGAVLDGDAVVTHAELMRTRMYDEYLRNIDTMHSAAICGALSADRGAFLTLGRSGGVGAYDADALNLLQLLAPHWVSALAQMREYQKLVLERSLNASIATAVFYLDARGCWVDQNAAAEPLLAKGWLTGRKGQRLLPVTASARLALEKALTSKLAVRPVPGVSLVALHDLAGTLVAFIRLHRLVPQALDGLASTKSVLAMFVQPICHRPSEAIPGVLESLFGFTAAESRLALALHQTADLQAAAREAGVSVATARSRVQLLLEKTGLHNQRSLLLMIEALVREV